MCGGYKSPWEKENHLKIFWKNCISLIRNFLDDNYDVVFNYIISKEIIRELKEEFKDTEIKFIVLISDEKTILKRDSMRPEELQMKERSLVLLQNTRKQDFEEKHILDTSKLSIDETVKTIIEEDRFY